MHGRENKNYTNKSSSLQFSEIAATGNIKWSLEMKMFRLNVRRLLQLQIIFVDITCVFNFFHISTFSWLLYRVSFHKDLFTFYLRTSEGFLI